MNTKKRQWRLQAGRLAAIGIAGAAFAFTGAPAHANGATTVEQDVQIEANIPIICEFEGGLSDLEIPVSDASPTTTPVSTSVNVSCNVTARVDLVSTRGGLRHDGHINQLADPPPSGFQTEFDYTATVTGPGNAELVSFDSSDPPAFGSKEPVTGTTHLAPSSAGSPAEITLDVAAQDVGTSVLAGGQYRDTLTVEVVPQ